MSKKIRQVTKFAVAAIVLFAVVVSLALKPMGVVPAAHAQSSLPSAEMLNAAAARQLIRFGFGPDAIAAAGGSSTGALAAALAGAQQEDLLALSALEADCEQAAQDVAELKAAIWRGGASTEQLSALQSAESELASRQPAVDQAEAALRGEMREFFVSALGAGNVILMERFNANRDRGVPDAMKALDLSDSQWLTLEAACVKSLRGLSLTTEESTLLAQGQSHATTVLVASRLQLNGPALQTCFHDLLTGSIGQ